MAPRCDFIPGKNMHAAKNVNSFNDFSFSYYRGISAHPAVWIMFASTLQKSEGFRAPPATGSPLCYDRRKETVGFPGRGLDQAVLQVIDDPEKTQPIAIGRFSDKRSKTYEPLLSLFWQHPG